MVDHSEPLLAKKVDDGEAPSDGDTLAGHSLEVERTTRGLFDQVQDDLASSFGLERHEEFRCLLRVAALCHDLGKASELFQQTLRGESRTKHPFWHEFVSTALLVGDTPVRQYLERGLDEPQIDTVACIVAGHHLRAEENFTSRRPRTGGTARRLLLNHPGLELIWGRREVKFSSARR